MCVSVCLSVCVSVSVCVEGGQAGNELSPFSTPLLTDVPVAGVTVRVLQDGKPRLNQWPRAGDAEVGGREGPARASLLSGFSSTGCKALLSTRCDQEDSQAWLTHRGQASTLCTASCPARSREPGFTNGLRTTDNGPRTRYLTVYNTPPWSIASSDPGRHGLMNMPWGWRN